ncbi:MAG: NAD(P)-dependent oxidoreductase, partial [Pirellulaceae bacterium]
MKPVCLTNADSYLAEQPAIEAWEMRVVRDIPPGEPWPEDDAERVTAIFSTHPPPNLFAFRNLRWVQIESAGYSQLFPFRLGERGIAVTNARGVFDCPIAEWNIAMMINLARDVRTLIRNQDAHVWDRSPRFAGEIRGRTLGIWGYGGIGRETARLAKLMGMRVHVLARTKAKSRADSTCVPGTGDPDGSLPDRFFHEREKDEFLSGLDFFIL